jgi:hypothetical protein
MANQCAHGQSRGRCTLHLRAERVIRPGSPSSVLGMVLATTSSSRVPVPQRGDPAQQVVGQGGGQQPGGVGGKPARGAVGQPRAVLEVADSQLDHGVAAVVLVQLHGGARPVGHERVVVPDREQPALGLEVAHAGHD